MGSWSWSWSRSRGGRCRSEEGKLEQDTERAQLMSGPKEQEGGGEEQLLSWEQQMETAVVRDRADSLRRLGPASSSPLPRQEGRWDK